MNRDFLKEAIADAKTVKESAIANAKAALEEAFSPQLQAMFASRLEEMEKEDMDEGYDEMDEAQGEGFDSTRGNYDLDGIPGNQLEEEDELDELLAELEKDEMNEESEDVTEGKEEIDEAEEVEEAEEDEAEEAEEDEAEDAEEGEDEEIDLEDMSEEDLKKFIEDVIEDMVSAGELEAGESFEDDVDVEAEDEIEALNEEETLNEEPVSIAAVAAGLAAMFGGAAALNKAVEKAEDGDFGPQAKKLADMLRGAGSAAAGVTQQRGVTEKVNKKVEEGLFDFLKKKKAEAPVSKQDSNPVVGVDWDGNYIRKDGTFAEAKEELDEAMDTIAALKSELNEINLLNAKLLYSNKIFKSKNMTESQKAKVLGAFDKATTVNEVKVVFETLNENFKPAKKTVNEGVIGSASKATGAVQTSKQPIVESDAMVNRFKKLAGII
jgi:hypothetical protein